MPFRLPLYLLLAILPATAAVAQPAHPVYVPPAEELPAPEDLLVPAEVNPVAPEAGVEAVEIEPDLALEPLEPNALLGVHVLPLTADLLPLYGPEVRGGVVIDSIGRGTPADIYRLPIGGLIVAVDNMRITQPADLAAVIGLYAPGDFVSIIYHDGRQFAERRVRLAPRPDPAAWAVPLPPQQEPPLILTPSSRSEAELLPVLPPVRMEDLQADEAIAPGVIELESLQQQLQELQQREEALRQQIDRLEAMLEAQGG